MARRVLLAAVGSLVGRLNAQSTRAVASATAMDSIIRHVVDSSLTAEHIPGAAVAVVQDRRVIYSRGFGLANIETKAAVDPARTVFRIGSISKVMTSLALLQLAEQRGLSLSTPVDQLIGSGWIDNRFSEPVRLWHLLTHTAAFDQLDTGRVVFADSLRRSLSAFLRGQLRVVRPPGAAASYDTYGMSLAGFVIESVSGIPYGEYMRRQVFAPLGMARTFVETPPELRSDLAGAYAWRDTAFSRVGYEYYLNTPAASIDGTVEDMARFMIAVLGDGSNANGRLYSPTMATQARSVEFSHIPGVPSFSYGFWEDVVNGTRVIHHGGDMLEYETEMCLVPALNAGVFVAYNHNGEAGGRSTALRQTLTKRLMDYWVPPRPPVPVGATRPIDVSRFVGAYASGGYCHTCVEGAGRPYGYFDVRAAGPGRIDIDGDRFAAVDSFTFALERDSVVKLAFRLDASGQVAYLVTRNGMRERLGDRLLTEVFGPGWETRFPQTLAARIFRDTGRPADCETAYSAIAARYRNGRAWYYAGQCAIRAGAPGRAIAALGAASALGQWPGPTAYLTGVAQAASGNIDAAFESLMRAKKLGAVDGPTLDREPRLASLRSDPRWAALRGP